MKYYTTQMSKYPEEFNASLTFYLFLKKNVQFESPFTDLVLFDYKNINNYLYTSYSIWKKTFLQINYDEG